MAATTRSSYYATFTKAKLTTDLALPEAPIGWEAFGFGPGGTLVTRRPDVSTPNSPVNGVTTVQKRYLVTPYVDIYQLYFNSIPAARFAKATLTFDATNVFVNLNLEE